VECDCAIKKEQSFVVEINLLPVSVIPFKKSSNPILSSVPISVSRATIELGRHGNRWILMKKGIKIEQMAKSSAKESKTTESSICSQYIFVTQLFS